MNWQEAAVAAVVLAAAGYLWRRFRPPKRRTVAFIPLGQVRPRERPSSGGKD